MLCCSNFLLVPCSPSSIPLSAGPLSCWGLVFITSADRDPPSPLCSLLRSTPCIPKISYKYIKYILLKMNLMWTHKICHLNTLTLLSWRSLRKKAGTSLWTPSPLSAPCFLETGYNIFPHVIRTLSISGEKSILFSEDKGMPRRILINRSC